MKRSYILTDKHSGYRIVQAESGRAALEQANRYLSRWTKAQLMPTAPTVIEALYSPTAAKRAAKSNDGHYYAIGWIEKRVGKTGVKQVTNGTRRRTTLGAARKLATQWQQRGFNVIITEHFYDVRLTREIGKMFR